jgi:hypothetical protein
MTSEDRARVEVPAPGTEERDFWITAAEQYGASGLNEALLFEVGEEDLLRLMAACREQGRRDVLGLQPGEMKR